MSEIGVRAVYEFGEFRADPLSRQLFANGSPLSLTPKAFDTLIVLLSNAGTVLTKDDLINAIWGETAVEENNLTQQISTIRRTLGDRSTSSRFVVTVPGRGYAFAAPVRRVEVDHAAEMLILERSSITIDVSTGRDPSRRWRDGRLGMALAMAYVLLVAAVCLMPHPSSVSSPKTVAVLNFRSFDGEGDVVGQGIRDTLRARLGSLEDVAVRPSSPQLSEQDIIDAGRAMNVDLIVTGSVQHDSTRIRVAVELVDVGGGRLLWGETFDRSEMSAFELQDSIAAHVVHALSRRPLPATHL